MAKKCLRFTTYNVTTCYPFRSLKEASEKDSLFLRKEHTMVIVLLLSAVRLTRLSFISYSLLSDKMGIRGKWSNMLALSWRPGTTPCEIFLMAIAWSNRGKSFLSLLGMELHCKRLVDTKKDRAFRWVSLLPEAGTHPNTCRHPAIGN